MNPRLRSMLALAGPMFATILVVNLLLGNGFVVGLVAGTLAAGTGLAVQRFMTADPPAARRPESAAGSVKVVLPQEISPDGAEPGGGVSEADASGVPDPVSPDPGSPDAGRAGDPGERGPSTG